MPWRFVEMYGRTQFSDIVVLQALEENNRALRLLGRGDETLSIATAHSLAVSLRRLESAWALLEATVPQAAADAARARHCEIDALLAPRLRIEARDAALHRLAQRASGGGDQPTTDVLETLTRSAPNAALPEPRLTELSVSFQAESCAWREMPMPGTEERHVLDAFERCYARGRSLGRGQTATSGDWSHRDWRHAAELTFFQLDAMRITLSTENRATRWCLGRLVDTLCKLDGYLEARRLLASADVGAKARACLDGMLDARIAESRRRAGKLLNHAYGVDPATYRARVAADAARFALAHTQALPRTA